MFAPLSGGLYGFFCLGRVSIRIFNSTIKPVTTSAFTGTPSNFASEVEVGPRHASDWQVVTVCVVVVTFSTFLVLFFQIGSSDIVMAPFLFLFYEVCAAGWLLPLVQFCPPPPPPPPPHLQYLAVWFVLPHFIGFAGGKKAFVEAGVWYDANGGWPGAMGDWPGTRGVGPGADAIINCFVGSEALVTFNSRSFIPSNHAFTRILSNLPSTPALKGRNLP